jgi:hypothetical protein
VTTSTARRYALTGVFTDMINSGQVFEATFTTTDPVAAAAGFLGRTREGFRTVLVEATPDDGTPAFAPLPPVELMRAAHQALGRTLDGEPTGETADSPLAQARYQALVRAQAGCLLSMLLPEDPSGDYANQPERLSEWARAGAAFVIDVGFVPPDAVVQEAIADFPDPDRDGPRVLRDAAREMLTLVRYRTEGLPGIPARAERTLRDGWPHIRSVRSGFWSAHSDALEQWWLDRMTEHDPAIGPLLDDVLASEPVQADGALGRQARQEARQVLSWEPAPQRRDRFATALESLRDPGASRPVPGLEGVDLPTPRPLDLHAAAEQWRAAAPHSRSEAARQEELARTSRTDLDAAPLRGPEYDRIQARYQTRLEVQLNLEADHTVMGLLRDVHTFERQVAAAREELHRHGLNAAAEATGQAPVGGEAPPSTAQFADHYDAAVAPGNAALDELLTAQRRFARAGIAAAVPAARRSPEEHLNAIQRIVEAHMDDTVLRYAHTNVESSAENADRAARAAQLGGERPPTDEQVAAARAVADDFAALYRNLRHERTAALDARDVLDQVLDERPDRNLYERDGRALVAAHAEQLAQPAVAASTPRPSPKAAARALLLQSEQRRRTSTEATPSRRRAADQQTRGLAQRPQAPRPPR